LVLAVVALVASHAAAATLNKRARMREGPSKDTALLGWVEGGTSVTLEGERNGWYAVRTPDGASGYVWQDHVALAPGERAPGPASATAATVTTLGDVVPTPPPTAAPEVRPVVAAAAERSPDPVLPELERLRTEVSRLAKAQEELAERLPRAGTTPTAPTPPLANDGSAGAAALFLAVGALVGWLFGRFAQARRERRSRIRI
jgi:uncharacterized protein YgiM (DUF1202 family)